ncbi:von Willebrand factor A [Knoellia sinensis KCTC 19936]|uniref:von Willebrand factor A n=1 Tax=Knoellia sinensis KCTC 19936 TaxID=1385520 RepID=A0A0A0J6J5_9MICO|nr:substrate-binding and VWA domain-containing protein [Knoellia sinensis]KGN31687.1 von Willebrand factor A [Knoellia sinensis KCTC 19936]
MGRHQAENSSPSQKAIIAALVTGAIVVAGGAYAIGKGTGSGEEGPFAGGSGEGCSAAPLRVEASPEIADLVKTQLATATKENGCHRYEVTGTRSSSVASRIRQGKAPDVWIADSTVWLDQTTAGSAGSAVKADWVSSGSLAHSPVVLANPLQSPDKFSGEFTSWNELINKSGAIHLANPHLDSASRLAFLASREGTRTKDVASGQRIILLSRFAATSTADLLLGASDPAKSNTTRSEPFPISEQALANYAKTSPGVLSPMLPKDGTHSLDYPWVPAPDLSAAHKDAANAGFRALTSPAAVEAFTKAGFRDGENTGGPTIGDVEAASFTALKPKPAAERLESLREWDVLKADARMLAILDVSGSMTNIAPDTGGKTRAKVAEESMITAVQRLPDGSQVGGWIFSTDKGGKGKDHAPLTPIARLDEPSGAGTHRDSIVAALKKFQTYLGGDTGLYDTTADAYAEMTRTYDPEYFNSVVIITDGKNDDPGGGLNLEQLLAQLKKGHDPTKPVRIVTIGMGEADTKALSQISQATGGSSYTANTSDDLLTVFVQALLAREPAQAP